MKDAGAIYAILDGAFSEHEMTREPSVEFKRPGPSPWRYAQQWAQRAVDRDADAPLPSYEPVYDVPNPASFVSYALGVALGRFGSNGEGVLDEAPPTTIPDGILFLSAASEQDCLSHPSCAPLLESWTQYGSTVGGGDDLRTYLRKSFFAYHKEAYENRPIYFPLSSEKKSFVAWISIHRWKDDTLHVLLADHLRPERRKLEGEIEDLRTAKAQGDKGAKSRAEKRFAEVQKLLKELSDFIDVVAECAEKGPPPPRGEKVKEREANARFAMELDDGVMVNSAALWPLLDPQWKEPRKWWSQLANEKGPKGTDFDWSKVAARYFPERVKRKCHADPSLAVAHQCFWELHPAKAFAWTQRLRNELRADFKLEEPGSDEAWAKFLDENPEEARKIEQTERVRHARKTRKDGADDAGPLFEEDQDDALRAANE